MNEEAIGLAVGATFLGVVGYMLYKKSRPPRPLSHPGAAPGCDYIQYASGKIFHECPADQYDKAMKDPVKGEALAMLEERYGTYKDQVDLGSIPPQENYGGLLEVITVGGLVVTSPIFYVSWPVIGAAYLGTKLLFREKKEVVEFQPAGGGGIALPLAIGGGAVLIAIVLLNKEKEK